MEDWLQHVPAGMRGRFDQVDGLIATFCAAHLNGEYRDVCRKMAVLLCQEGSPVTRGKAEGWAAGIVWSAGWVNFLSDPAQRPHMRGEAVAKGFGVSLATMQAKSRIVRDVLDLCPFDPNHTLPSMKKDNPMTWMVQLTNGVILDLRRAPREMQAEAFERGMIPYIPADLEPGTSDDGS